VSVSRVVWGVDVGVEGVDMGVSIGGTDVVELSCVTFPALVVSG